MKLKDSRPHFRTPEVRAKAVATLKANVLKHILSAPFEELKGKHHHKTRILHEQDGLCKSCGIPEVWNDKPLKFHLEHISGDRTDNSRLNLCLLCPNCHSQTPTYCRAKKSKKRQ